MVPVDGPQSPPSGPILGGGYMGYPDMHIDNMRYTPYDGRSWFVDPRSPRSHVAGFMPGSWEEYKQWRAVGWQ